MGRTIFYSVAALILVGILALYGAGSQYNETLKGEEFEKADKPVSQYTNPNLFPAAD